MAQRATAVMAAVNKAKEATIAPVTQPKKRVRAAATESWPERKQHELASSGAAMEGQQLSKWSASQSASEGEASGATGADTGAKMAGEMAVSIVGGGAPQNDALESTSCSDGSAAESDESSDC